MAQPLRLKTLLGDYPGTLALKKGEIRSDTVALEFAEVAVPSSAFKRVVREREFDVAELAIVTYLIAKAHGKPLVLLPVVVLGRFQHPYLLYNAARGPLAPEQLCGRRIGIRSYSVTTSAWIRGMLMADHGVDPGSVTWVTFEDPHVAEFRDPPNVERAPAGAELTAMLLEGRVDAIVGTGREPKDERIRPLFADPEAAAREWHRRNGAIQINHMVTVSESLSRSNPGAVREVYRMLAASRRAAGQPAGSVLDTTPVGLEANRRNLDVAIEYVYRQGLIPRRFPVDELFDDTTRALG
ncbi:MAG: hypothetical protein IT514_14240 [Burkholderiales bacterium]|nr:hypothetical protein [Burkholderiales bacterium]